jgi:AcrR family transcriptional regulator
MRVRTEAKREAILEIAAKAFIEMGYERASMAEISARVGGSKATLYGYFESKEQLFIAVTTAAGEKHLADAFAELAQSAADVPVVLQRVGEKLMGFLVRPEALATQRMVIAEAGHSDIGQRFYEAGPGRGLEAMTVYLQAAMDSGRLRAADARIAAQHLDALFQAETMPLRLLGVPASTSRAHIRKAIERALTVFLAAYGASSPAQPDADIGSGRRGARSRGL